MHAVPMLKSREIRESDDKRLPTATACWRIRTGCGPHRSPALSLPLHAQAVRARSGLGSHLCSGDSGGNEGGSCSHPT